jgi:hypothetical protein
MLGGKWNAAVFVGSPGRDDAEPVRAWAEVARRDVEALRCPASTIRRASDVRAESWEGKGCTGMYGYVVAVGDGAVVGVGVGTPASDGANDESVLSMYHVPPRRTSVSVHVYLTFGPRVTS